MDFKEAIYGWQKSNTYSLVDILTWEKWTENKCITTTENCYSCKIKSKKQLPNVSSKFYGHVWCKQHMFYHASGVFRCMWCVIIKFLKSNIILFYIRRYIFINHHLLRNFSQRLLHWDFRCITLGFWNRNTHFPTKEMIHFTSDEKWWNRTYEEILSAIYSHDILHI